VERELLTRDTQNKKIAGVCAGFIGYLIAWIVMPKDRIPTAPAVQNFARYPG
jgi:phage shock protein PspC (stress-responsive transcriptional regulator)